jgi:4-hydroxy-tetrahydrodipicolinate synthase
MVPWLRGVIPAVITPFDSDGRIDEKALRTEIEFHLTSGVTALCAGGSTGEGAGLSRDEVKQLNTIFVDQVNGRAPVIAGVIPDTTDEAVSLGLAAKEAGVAALQVTLPHYLFQPAVPELVSYYSEIRDRTGLGIILYNVLPWAQVTPEGVRKLIESDAIIAVKQSGSNMHQLADMVYYFGRQIPILSAVDDLLYPSFVIGAHGTLSAIASVLPAQCVELYQAVQQGNHSRALKLHNQLLVVWRAMEDMTGFSGRVKCAIELQGRLAGVPRRPHRAAREDERDLLRMALQEAGIPLAEPQPA